MVEISASLLAADFTCLGSETRRAESAGVNSFHFDLMDGHYVPNLALAPEHLHALRTITPLPFNAHLELNNPDEVLERFRPLEAQLIIVCHDTLPDPLRTFALIRAQAAKVGLSINPDEAIEDCMELFPELDLLLILGVTPGFGGQNMQLDTPARVFEARQKRPSSEHSLLIAVDGGVKSENAATLIQAGADISILGTALFQAPSMKKVVRALKTTDKECSDQHLLQLDTHLP